MLIRAHIWFASRIMFLFFVVGVSLAMEMKIVQKQANFVQDYIDPIIKAINNNDSNNCKVLFNKLASVDYENMAIAQEEDIQKIESVIKNFHRADPGDILLLKPFMKFYWKVFARMYQQEVEKSKPLDILKKSGAYPKKFKLEYKLGDVLSILSLVLSFHYYQSGIVIAKAIKRVFGSFEWKIDIADVRRICELFDLYNVDFNQEFPQKKCLY